LAEGDEVGPVDANVALHPASAHSADQVHRLGAAHQHLLGVAAPQSASAAERACVDHGDRPPGGADAVAGDLRGRTGADDDEIVLLGHRTSSIRWPPGSRLATERRHASWVDSSEA